MMECAPSRSSEHQRGKQSSKSSKLVRVSNCSENKQAYTYVHLLQTRRVATCRADSKCRQRLLVPMVSSLAVIVLKVSSCGCAITRSLAISLHTSYLNYVQYILQNNILTRVNCLDRS